MISILYNPLSRNGNNDKLLNKIKNKVKKRFNTDNINLVNFFNLNLELFIKELKKEDKVILVGGDGTLNFAANYLKDKKIYNDFYLYKAGTGNDFGRCFKGELVKLNNYITNLPKVVVNEHEYVYINGCGIGVDGETCYLVDHSGKKNKFNFFKSACISFLKFKKMDLLINMDGKEYTFNKVWFTTVMNGKYFGGGMKLTPDSIREDDILELIIIDKVKLIPLILIFPTIYLGWHYFFKRYVHHFKVKEVEIKVLNGKYTYQHDGETIRDIDHFYVKKG